MARSLKPNRSGPAVLTGIFFCTRDQNFHRSRTCRKVAAGRPVAWLLLQYYTVRRRLHPRESEGSAPRWLAVTPSDPPGAWRACDDDDAIITASLPSPAGAGHKYEGATPLLPPRTHACCAHADHTSTSTPPRHHLPSLLVAAGVGVLVSALVCLGARVFPVNAPTGPAGDPVSAPPRATRPIIYRSARHARF